MQEPVKPKSISDIVLGFEQVGDEGWAEPIQSILESYGVPMPPPSSENEIDVIKDCCDGIIPHKYELFLRALGPLDLEFVKFLKPPHVTTAEKTWFGSVVPGMELDVLKQQLAIIDLGGTGDFLSLNLQTNDIHYLCHDPIGMPIAFKSFEDLIRWAVAHVYTGGYGWPDESVQELVTQYQSRLTGLRI